MRLSKLFLILPLLLNSCSEKEEQSEISEKKERLYASPFSPNDTVVDIDLHTYLQSRVQKLDESGEFQTVSLEEKKYYAFYETASFCTPCHEFSPTLNTFYEVFHENYGDEFELFVVSYDLSPELKKEYAAKKMANLPHITYEDKNALKNEIPFLKELYPNLIITDNRGKVLQSSFNKQGIFHGPEVAMNYLKSILEEK